MTTTSDPAAHAASQAKSTPKKLRSPEDLDKNIEVTGPAVWGVLVACMVFLLAVFAWSVFGRVETHVTGTCAYIQAPGQSEAQAEDQTTDQAATQAEDQDSVQAYAVSAYSGILLLLGADDADKVQPGNPVVIDGQKLEVGYVTPYPISAEEEVSKAYLAQDFLRLTLFPEEWAHVVTVVRPGYGQLYAKLYERLIGIQATADKPPESYYTDDEMKSFVEAVDLQSYGFEPNRPLNATITTESVAPLSLVFS